MAKKEEKNVEEKKNGTVSNKLVQRWIDENIVDDVEDNYIIARLASEVIKKKFSSQFKSEELVLAFYGVVFESIMEVLLEKRNEYNSYNINIADRFEVGYTDADENEDMEKMGSFVPYIYDKKCGKKTYDNVEARPTIEVCTNWLSQNNIDNIEIIKKISTVAVKNLDREINLQLSHWETVIPFFIMIHESMISYLELKQTESGEYEIFINFASCFDVFVRLNEDKEVTIEYCPTITSKLETKSDAIATSKHE